MGSRAREHHAVGHVREMDTVVSTGSGAAEVNRKSSVLMGAREGDVVQRDRLGSLAGHQPFSRDDSIVQ